MIQPRGIGHWELVLLVVFQSDQRDVGGNGISWPEVLDVGPRIGRNGPSWRTVRESSTGFQVSARWRVIGQECGHDHSGLRPGRRADGQQTTTGRVTLVACRSLTISGQRKRAPIPAFLVTVRGTGAMTVEDVTARLRKQ